VAKGGGRGIEGFEYIAHRYFDIFDSFVDDPLRYNKKTRRVFLGVSDSHSPFIIALEKENFCNFALERGVKYLL
jgi:hypothetical protein